VEEGRKVEGEMREKNEFSKKYQCSKNESSKK
jgi:hypothetical protein